MKSVSKTRKIALALAKAAFSPNSPACEALSNQWILRDLIVASKSGIEHIIIAGGAYDAPTFVYSISTNSVTIGPADLRYCHGIALLNDKIFLVGGEVTSRRVVSLTISPTNEINSKMRWVSMPDLNTGRIGLGTGVVGERIYAIGGICEGQCLKTVESFSEKKMEWTPVASMQTGRYCMGVAVVGRKIFVFGGWDITSDDYLSTAEVLDTETNEWSSIPPMKYARSGMGITVIDDRFIWIAGGFCNVPHKNTIEVFDTKTYEWSTLSMGPLFRAAPFEMITVDHKIFFVGRRQIEVLDIDEMNWLTLYTFDRPLSLFKAIGF